MPPAPKPRPSRDRKLGKTRREPAQFPPTVEPPRGVLRAAEGRGSDFFHQRLAPTPALVSFVQHFWYVQWDLRNAPPSMAETLPHPSCYLVFEHDLELPIDDPKVHRLVELSGVCTGKFSRRMEGHGRVFGLKFQPGALRPFLHTPVSELTDRIVPAKEIFGDEILLLGTKLRTLDRAEQMAEAVTDYLATHLPVHDANVELATNLVNLILNDTTILRADQVSTHSGLSLRSLQRLFKEYVGASPKWVIRRFRLHEVLARLHSGDDIDAVQLALDLGYTDQAHFINDFRKLVGRAPAAYLRHVGLGLPNRS